LTGSDPPIALVGGIVAHNEEETVGPALRALLEQDLGDRAVWRTIWVVASGCTDRTVERAREAANGDPRVAIVEQRDRRGKADALNTIFDSALGDLLVLVNGDAVAEPGAIAALLAVARGLPAPFAIMGQPVPPPDHGTGAVAGAIGLLWRIHDALHAETLSHGEGNHLSDELLLVSLPVPCRFAEGTINDGAYLGAILGEADGRLAYAPAARVRIRVPTTVGDYLAQRRRIYAGHARQARVMGRVPTTLVSVALRAPARAARLVGRCAADSGRWGALPVLVSLEAAAIALALWDELPPRRSHVRWRRVETVAAWPTGSERGSSQT